MTEEKNNLEELVCLWIKIGDSDDCKKCDGKDKTCKGYYGMYKIYGIPRKNYEENK